MTDPLVTMVNVGVGAFFGLIAGAVAMAWHLARVTGDLVVRVLAELHREEVEERRRLHAVGEQLLREAGLKGTVHVDRR